MAWVTSDLDVGVSVYGTFFTLCFFDVLVIFNPSDHSLWLKCPPSLFSVILCSPRFLCLVWGLLPVSFASSSSSAIWYLYIGVPQDLALFSSYSIFSPKVTFPMGLTSIISICQWLSHVPPIQTSPILSRAVFPMEFAATRSALHAISILLSQSCLQFNIFKIKFAVFTLSLSSSTCSLSLCSKRLYFHLHGLEILEPPSLCNPYPIDYQVPADLTS